MKLAQAVALIVKMRVKMMMIAMVMPSLKMKK